MINYTTILFAIFVFLFGLHYYTVYEKNNNINIETMETMETIENKQNCYNMLIEHSNKYYLLNNKEKITKDTNPIIFDSLEEYKEFVEEEDLKGNKCPVVFLQYTTNTQNEELLQVKPSIFENNGGIQFKYKGENYYNKHKLLDASKDSTPIKNKIFNKNMYSGFDKQNQNIGRDTPLDRIFHSNSKISPNPLDHNWGGKKYTQNKIDKGEYKDREVYKYKNTTNFNNKINQRI